MAKILSHVWSSARGSVGGITYFPNQYGSIIARARVTPVNPATNRQEQARGSMQEAIEHWKIIDPSFRDGWNWYARNTVLHGPQNDYHIPGREMYARSYAPWAYLTVRGETIPAWAPNAPSNLGIPEVGPVRSDPLAAPGIGFTLSFNNENPEAMYFYGFIAGPFEDPKRRFKGPFLTESLNLSASIGSSAPGNLLFTNLVADKIYFWKLRCIGSQGTGVRLSSITYGRAASVETTPNGARTKSPPKSK